MQADRDLLTCPSWRENSCQLQRLGAQLFRETYERGIVHNEWRNAMIVLRATRVARDEDQKVLVLCRYVDHAEAARRRGPPGPLAQRRSALDVPAAAARTVSDFP